MDDLINETFCENSAESIDPDEAYTDPDFMHEPDIASIDMNTFLPYTDIGSPYKSFFEDNLANTTPYQHLDDILPLSNSEHIIGNPDFDSEVWHFQALPDSCAIVSQEFILESYIDHDIPEGELVMHAINNGYYMPGYGTLPEDVGRILEDYGIDVNRSEYNSFDDILNSLNEGQKIIVGLDCNEIWANSEYEQLMDILFYPQANHAVQVIGYDGENDEIILNDPGHPNGKSLHVSRFDFETAWQDSNQFMMVTANPPKTMGA